MAQTTFKINEVIDITENNTLSLINDEIENQGTVVIKDMNVDVYYPNGEHEEYGEDFQKLLDKVEDNGWMFIKLLKGDTRWKEFNPNPKGKNVNDCTITIPQKPYTELSYIFSRCLVIIPALPKSIIIERDSTKGGETTGSNETTLNKPPTNLFILK